MNLFRPFFIALIVPFIIQPLLYGQENPHPDKSETLRVVFYNVENLFDTFDDPLTNDDEFLPEADRRWDNKRFYKKLNNICRVIIGIGEWSPPGVIGLCEIENRFVLNQLVTKTPLSKFNYQVIHFESPDYRGIDVAMLYRPIGFTPDTSFVVSLKFPFDEDSRTRDILYVKGRPVNGDTLHFFINHWPSRYGGYLETKPKREYAAEVLRGKVDSLIRVEPSCRIIIMGDFNDNPTDESLSKILDAQPQAQENEDNELVNLMFPFIKGKRTGTLKFRESWDVFDQIIVTRSMLDVGGTTCIDPPEATIFDAEFLLEEDLRWGGLRPFRTYNGFSYLGGYSDHLPVFINLKLSGIF
jgi:hypothetical protein